MALVSFDRYQRMRSLQSRDLPKRVVNGLILVCLWLPLVTVLLPFLLPCKSVCAVLPTMGFCFSFTAITIWSIKIIRAISKYIENSEGPLRENLVENEKHATKTIIIISACFLVFHSPVIIALLVTTIFGASRLNNHLIGIGVLLSSCNSIINPILYSFRTKPIRKTFRKLFSYI